ncbi:MAG: NUDIX hydrolase [Candidatus Aenigmatarchaeota archaeon]
MDYAWSKDSEMRMSAIKVTRPTVPVAVDAVVIHRGRVLLLKRKTQPFKGSYALPGGFVIPGEKTKEACIREVKEETGLEVKILDLIGIYDSPNRDPRGHVISIAYFCKPIGNRVKARREAEEVDFFPIKEALKLNLGFDHRKILIDIMRRKK